MKFDSIAEFKEYLESKYGEGGALKDISQNRMISYAEQNMNKFSFSLIKKTPKLNGFQMYEYPDGSFYYGTFRDDYIYCHKDELPKLFNINKKLQREIPYMYKGTLVNNMKEGFGKEYYSDVNYYEGFFKKNKKEGKGKIMNLEDGYLYIGQFKNNQKEGSGLLIDLLT